MNIIEEEAHNWAEDQILDRDKFRKQIKDAFMQGAAFFEGNDLAFKKMSDLVLEHKGVIQQMKLALHQSVEIIKEWHNGGFKPGRLNEPAINKMWETYYNHSPEMKMIRELLEKFNDTATKI